MGRPRRPRRQRILHPQLLIGPRTAVGAWVIAAGFGFPSTVIAAIVLALAALVVVAVAIRVERAWARRSEPILAEAAC